MKDKIIEECFYSAVFTFKNEGYWYDATAYFIQNIDSQVVKWQIVVTDIKTEKIIFTGSEITRFSINDVTVTAAWEMVASLMRKLV